MSTRLRFLPPQILDQDQVAWILGDNLLPVYKKLRQFAAILNHIIIDRGIHPCVGYMIQQGKCGIREPQVTMKK